MAQRAVGGRLAAGRRWLYVLPPSALIFSFLGIFLIAMFRDDQSRSEGCVRGAMVLPIKPLSTAPLPAPQCSEQHFTSSCCSSCTGPCRQAVAPRLLPVREAGGGGRQLTPHVLAILSRVSCFSSQEPLAAPGRLERLEVILPLDDRVVYSLGSVVGTVPLVLSGPGE